jgi:hypothetical protein
MNGALLVLALAGAIAGAAGALPEVGIYGSMLVV